MGKFIPYSEPYLRKMLQKATNLESLSDGEICFLLNLSKSEDIAHLFKVARDLRYRFFDGIIFLYGFIYFSTWCRNDCIFCFYRRSNALARRYRKVRSEIIQIGCRLAEWGVNLIDLTMGEDPFFYQGDRGFLELIELVKAFKSEIGLPLMVSPGVILKDALQDLTLAGADWYACYQETHNRGLFKRLRVEQNYDKRLKRKMEARRFGLLIEEGIMTGVGDSSRDIVASIQTMKRLRVHQVRAMSFVPQRGTPLEHVSPPPPQRELIIIAVLRLLFPDRLIPASLDVGGIKGLKDRLQAGANVVTSLVPPHTGLVGVSQSSLDIESGYRTIKSVLPIIEKLSLKVATSDEYIKWVRYEREGIKYNYQS
jgi:methylornithine synthase